MFDLSGKSALVTGASGGIGGATARALHAAGASLVLTGTRKEALHTLAGELGERTHVITADLSDSDAIAALVSSTEEAAGQIDILVNNAGLTRDMLSMRLTDEDWSTVLDVNLGAAFRLSRAVLRGMMQRRWGRIVNITSIVGVTGNAGQANYAASKAGMIGMSKSIAQEVAARGVTVNCVAPGKIGGERSATAGISPVSADDIPLGREGEIEEAAFVVCALCMPHARFMTGQTVHVSGGLYFP